MLLFVCNEITREENTHSSESLSHRVMFWTVVLVVLLVTIAWFLYRSTSQSPSTLPGPAPQWLLGNLRNTGITSGRVAFHEALANLKETYGDAYSFWMGPYEGVVLSRLEDVRHVFADRQTYDQSERTTSSFGVLFPTGLIALRGDDWKRHARFMLPMFRRAKVLPYLDTIVRCIDQFVDEQFVPRDGQIHADLVVQTQRCLLNVIAFVAFDFDLEKASAKGADLGKAINDFVHYGNQFVLSAGIPLWLGKLLLMIHWRFRRAIRIMKHHVMNIITDQMKRQERESSKPKSLIASLVSALKSEAGGGGGALSLNELFDEVSLSILAGFETTATTTSWFIYYMSKHPDIQQKIKDELKEHHLTSDTPLTQDVLDSLVYADCVVKEVLRAAPIGAAVSRQATRDDRIDSIPIKKGQLVIIATQNLHADPRYWKLDPKKFLPERFLDEDKYPPNGAYLPFGGGHRACAGQEFALFELKTIFVRLMQRLTFEDPGDEANNSGGFSQRITCFPKHLAVRVRVD